MMLILIGVLLYYFAVIFYLRKKSGREFFIVTSIFLLDVLIGCFCPLSGYEEYKLVDKEYLKSFTEDDHNDGGERKVYVISLDDKEYKYKTLGNESEVKTVKGNVAVEKSNEYIHPIKCTYVRKGKFSIWTFGGIKQTKTVFYLPNDDLS
ncbi:MAG: hypothetical protein IKF52_06495 [Clostridia bacterium]|nr:hypothetical protein [Clostridia bacterium]